MHGIMYIGKSGMLRLGTITLGVGKLNEPESVEFY